MSSEKFSRDLVNVTLGLVLWILLLPVLLLTILPFAGLRFLVHYLSHHFRPDLIPVTNVIDSVLIYKPSSMSAILPAVQVWKIRGRLDVSSFRKHFYKVFLSSKELRAKYRNLYCHFVQWMFYCFKKPVIAINLEDRIREHKLEDGESLEKFVAKWMSTNDYGTRPNWEILIIHMENKNEKAIESALLFKIDHGLCDGYTFVHLIDELTGVKAPYIVQADNIGLITKLKYIVSFPVIIAGYAIKFLNTKDLLLPVKTKNPKWFVSFTTLNLELIKQIRRKTKAHFNTVVGILQIGALRRHLLESGKAISAAELPEITWLPSPRQWPGHPSMDGGGMTNHLTLGWTEVPLREPDSLKRLMAAEKDYENFIEIGLEKSLVWLLAPICWTIPAPMFRAFLQFCDAIQLLPISHGQSPLMCSNEPYQILGLNVEHIYLPVQLQDFLPSIGMNIVPVSNSGQLDISVNATTEVFKSQEDLDRFTKTYLDEELKHLANCCEC